MSGINLQLGPEANGQAPIAPLLRAMGMSRRTVERLKGAGAIRPARVKLPGRLVRFLADECRGWIAAHCPPRDDWQRRNGQEFLEQKGKG